VRQPKAETFISLFLYHKTVN